LGGGQSGGVEKALCPKDRFNGPLPNREEVKVGNSGFLSKKTFYPPLEKREETQRKEERGLTVAGKKDSAAFEEGKGSLLRR